MLSVGVGVLPNLDCFWNLGLVGLVPCAGLAYTASRGSISVC